jgi:hypothetical protein
LSILLDYIQGVPFVSIGSCPSDSSRVTADDVALESSGFIPIAMMTQFQSEGYNLVRKLDYSKVNGEVRMPSLAGNEASARSDTSSSFDLRITTNGFEFISKVIANDLQTEMASVIAQSSEPYNPVHNGSHRALKVIGADTRRRVTNTLTYRHVVR